MTFRIAAVLPLLAFLHVPAYAADSGFYIGGGIGSATIEDDPPSFEDIDESDTAWKAYVGYRFGGFIPLLDVAGEITYRDMGSPDGSGFEYDASGYDASALGIVTLGPIDLFARLGVGNYSIDRRINGTRRDEDGTGTLVGLGAGFRLFKINVRAEWERIDADGADNIDMFTVNAYWRF